jgi:hypothetical protein
MIPRHGDLTDDLTMAQQLVPDDVWAAIQPPPRGSMSRPDDQATRDRA